MKNAISRRSFLKAVGIMSAAGALAACGGKSASTSTAACSSSNIRITWLRLRPSRFITLEICTSVDT